VKARQSGRKGRRAVHPVEKNAGRPGRSPALAVGQVVEIYEGPLVPDGLGQATATGGSELDALLREIEELSGLAHPHLVRVAGWGDDAAGVGRRLCLLTELCACGTVADALARFTPMDGGRAHVNAARRWGSAARVVIALCACARVRA
jgi:hypothetical protein